MVEEDTLYIAHPHTTAGLTSESDSDRTPRVDSPDFLELAFQEDPESSSGSICRKEETDAPRTCKSVNDVPTNSSVPEIITPESPEVGHDNSNITETNPDTPSTLFEPQISLSIPEAKEPSKSSSKQQVSAAPRRSHRVRSKQQPPETNCQPKPISAQPQVTTDVKRSTRQTKPRKSLKRKAPDNEEVEDNTMENAVVISRPETEDKTQKTTKRGNARKSSRTKAKEPSNRSTLKDRDTEIPSSRKPSTNPKTRKKEAAAVEGSHTDSDGLRRSKRKRNA